MEPNVHIIKREDFIIRPRPSSGAKERKLFSRENKEKPTETMSGIKEEIESNVSSAHESIKITQHTDVKASFSKQLKKVTFHKSIDHSPDEVFAVKYDHESRFLACGLANGSVKFYSVSTNTIINSVFTTSGSDGTPCTSVKWKPLKNSYICIAGNSDGTVSQWQATNGKMLYKNVEKDNQVLTLDYNLSGSCFATAGKDYHVRIYDDEKKVIVREFEEGDWQALGHSNRVFSVKFSNENDHVLLSGGWDSSVFIWDTRDRKATGHIFGPSISGDTIDIKGNIVLTGSYRNDNQLQLWDMRNRSLITTLEWENGVQCSTAYIYACQFSKSGDDTILAGSSGKNELKIYDKGLVYKPSWTISGLKKGIFTLDADPTGSHLAFGGSSMALYLCNIGKMLQET